MCGGVGCCLPEVLPATRRAYRPSMTAVGLGIARDRMSAPQMCVLRRRV
jgi:hypothetical protein